MNLYHSFNLGGIRSHFSYCRYQLHIHVFTLPPGEVNISIMLIRVSETLILHLLVIKKKIKYPVIIKLPFCES